METATSQLVDIVFALSDSAIDVPALGLRIPILELLHAILINYTYRTALKQSHAEIGWGQGLLATIVMAAGGGSTTALLLGNPLGILKSNRFWGIYGVRFITIIRLKNRIMLIYKELYEEVKFIVYFLYLCIYTCIGDLLAYVFKPILLSIPSIFVCNSIDGTTIYCC